MKELNLFQFDQNIIPQSFGVPLSSSTWKWWIDFKSSILPIWRRSKQIVNTNNYMGLCTYSYTYIHLNIYIYMFFLACFQPWDMLPSSSPRKSPSHPFFCTGAVYHHDLLVKMGKRWDQQFVHPRREPLWQKDLRVMSHEASKRQPKKQNTNQIA